MVQDTLATELYASTLDSKGATKLGGWGLADAYELDEADLNLDYSKLKERTPYWVVSVPGESKWLSEVPGCLLNGVCTASNVPFP